MTASPVNPGLLEERGGVLPNFLSTVFIAGLSTWHFSSATWTSPVPALSLSLLISKLDEVISRSMVALRPTVHSLLIDGLEDREEDIPHRTKECFGDFCLSTPKNSWITRRLEIRTSYSYARDLSLPMDGNGNESEVSQRAVGTQMLSLFLEGGAEGFSGRSPPPLKKQRSGPQYSPPCGG